jgi:hypothetical protein
MSHRIEVLVDDAPYEALEAMARRYSRSVAEIVGDLVRQHVAPSGPSPATSLADIEGIVDDPGAATSDHDAALYGASKPR